MFIQLIKFHVIKPSALPTRHIIFKAIYGPVINLCTWRCANLLLHNNLWQSCTVLLYRWLVKRNIAHLGQTFLWHITTFLLVSASDDQYCYRPWFIYSLLPCSTSSNQFHPQQTSYVSCLTILVSNRYLCRFIFQESILTVLAGNIPLEIFPFVSIVIFCEQLLVVCKKCWTEMKVLLLQVYLA